LDGLVICLGINVNSSKLLFTNDLVLSFHGQKVLQLCLRDKFDIIKARVEAPLSAFAGPVLSDVTFMYLLWLQLLQSIPPSSVTITSIEPTAIPCCAAIAASHVQLACIEETHIEVTVQPASVEDTACRTLDALIQ
jgi:hypothetical protein